MWSKLKENKLVQNIKANVSKLGEEELKMDIVEVTDRVYHISYPQERTLHHLKQHIQQVDFQIWNISQYPYSSKLQHLLLEGHIEAEVHHLCFQYYSSLPLYDLLLAINSIGYFLSVSPHHRVYIHCQDNKLRSSVFLACFLHRHRSKDLTEAILEVNKKLSVEIEVERKDLSTANYKSEHMFFKNYINYHNNPAVINTKQLELLKILVNDAPALKKGSSRA